MCMSLLTKSKSLKMGIRDQIQYMSKVMSAMVKGSHIEGNPEISRISKKVSIYTKGIKRYQPSRISIENVSST